MEANIPVMSAACPRLGFTLRLRLAPDADGVAVRDALGAALGARGLETEPAARDPWTLVVTREGGQAIDADREALTAWAASRDDVVACEAGPIVDLSDRG